MFRPLAILIPVAVGLPELVGPEGVVQRDDATDWAGAVQALWGDRELLARRGAAALESARERFGEDRYHEQLLRLYG